MVVVGDEDLRVQFGPWSLRTNLGNIVGVSKLGSSSWLKAVGPRLSLADRGITFGTVPEDAVCVLFERPVGGIDPWHVIKHPGMTVTLDDPQGFIEELESRGVSQKSLT